MTRIPVCIFAKPPVPGKVKTRLVRSIGEEAAASLASAMLRDTWSTVNELREAIPVLAVAEEGCFPVSVPHENVWLQRIGELGLRIESILQRALCDAPAAIALGADSPLVITRHLRDAINRLESSDAVIGPSRDGGFYLLGVRRCPCGLLQNLPWSTAETAQRTQDRLQLHQMSVSELETLLDVDTPDDIQSLYSELSTASPVIAPATRQWLREFQWSASSFRL